MTDTNRQTEIRTEAAPAPVGPYSQAIRLGELVFVSGQIPLDASTGKIVSGEIEDEARQVLSNLEAVLAASGSALARVVKTTVYLTDISLFPRINAIYAEAFNTDPSPARATVEVSALPLGARIEIDAIASANGFTRPSASRIGARDEAN
jgi:2-iminobutanoate/2-iminopropanoate deaminase